MTFSLALTTAAKMAAESYLPGRTHLGGRRIIAKPLLGDATAFLVEGNIVVIQGSNSMWDYLKYNVRIVGVGRQKLALKSKALSRDAKGVVWHQGFLRHALEVQTWLTALKRRPKFFVGHSLGAATVQILSPGYGVPGIGFAPPGICMNNPTAADNKRCLLICRSDDIVTQVPEGFAHLGKTLMLQVTAGALPRHKMIRYTPLIDTLVAQKKLTAKWPA